MKHPLKIEWYLNREKGRPYGDRSPFAALFDPVAMPEPWPSRPWIFANMVASKNGVTAWERADADDDPVLAILGGDETRAERKADKLQMRLLRSIGDMAIGAQTVREQLELVQTPQEPGKDDEPELQEVYEALYDFRRANGLTYHPKNIIYSPSGNMVDPKTGENLLLRHPIFGTVGLIPLVVTTEKGAARLSELGVRERPQIVLITEQELDASGLLQTHQKLFRDFGIRYLNCEGGETILHGLHKAGLLDEVFVTYTDVTVNVNEKKGVKKIFDFEGEGGELIAEGKISPDSGYIFRRWRFNER